jgi:hypothetical protein
VLLLEVIVLGVVMAVVSLVGPAAFRAKVRKRLRSTPSKVEHGALVTLIGRILETNELVEAPLTGRRGVLVAASAEMPEYGPDGPLIYRSFTMKPFDLDTVAAGIVRIDATMADIAIRPAAPKPRSSKREEAFMVSRGRGAISARVATFRELVLVPGMRIAVHGLALIEEDQQAERGYRDGAPQRTRIVSPKSGPIAIGDPPLC